MPMQKKVKKSKSSTKLSQYSWNQLEDLFQNSTTPSQPVNGFYKGKLLHTRLGIVPDLLIKLFKKQLMPWKGKSFVARKKRGVNVVSRKAAFLFRWKNPTHSLKHSERTIEVFPFATSKGASKTDRKKKVFLINYNSVANPQGVRRVTDELVQVENGVYLGRAQLKEGKQYRTVAYFSLVH